MKQAIEQLKSDALRLASNHHDMEAYAIFDEAGLLHYQLKTLQTELCHSVDMDWDELESMDGLLAKAEDAMRIVSDVCEMHCNRSSTRM